MRSSPARALCQNAEARPGMVAYGRRKRIRQKMQLRLNGGLTNAVKVRQGLPGSAGGPPKSMRDYRVETEEKDQRYTGDIPEVHWRYIGTTPWHLPTTSLACPMHYARAKSCTRDSLQIAGRLQPFPRACIWFFPLPRFRRMFRRSKVRLQAVGFAG